MDELTPEAVTEAAKRIEAELPGMPTAGEYTGAITGIQLIDETGTIVVTMACEPTHPVPGGTMTFTVRVS